MAHPDDRLLRNASEEAIRLLHVTLGPAILPVARRRQHLGAEQVTGKLHAVADAQDGDAKIKESGVAMRGARRVNAGGSAGEDQALGMQFSDAGRRQVVAHDLAEDVLLAHPPGDQLGVLRAEVEDEDTFTFGLSWHHGLLLLRLTARAGKGILA